MSIKFYSRVEKGWLIPAPFEAMTFPGGEPHIKATKAERRFDYQIAVVHGADSHDLFTLAMWADLVAARDEETRLILPYLPGARADRGTPWGAAIYADFLEHVVSPHQIITLDPHSDVMPGLLSSKRLTVFPFERIIRNTLGDRGDYYMHPYTGVIAPDKGAVARAARAATVLGVPVYYAGKERDFETGELTGFTCEELPESGKLLLVDDIIDGGGTFIGLAQTLAEEQGVGRERLDLWGTHGIFSKGVAELTYYFDHIYTTDSWGTTEQAENLKVITTLPYLIGEINV